MPIGYIRIVLQPSYSQPNPRLPLGRSIYIYMVFLCVVFLRCVCVFGVVGVVGSGRVVDVVVGVV